MQETRWVHLARSVGQAGVLVKRPASAVAKQAPYRPGLVPVLGLRDAVPGILHLLLLLLVILFLS